jgi:hypothetical protein
MLLDAARRSMRKNHRHSGIASANTPIHIAN